MTFQTSRATVSGPQLERPGVEMALTTALGRTVATIAASSPARSDELEQLLKPVVAVLAATARGEFGALSTGLPFGLSADHLHQIRVELIGALGEMDPTWVDPAELVLLLTGIEDMARRVTVNATNQFVEQLSAPDSLNAVIEVAHDMRAPLGSILFLVDAIRRGRSGPVTPVQERQLGLIYGAALGLSNVACDVVDAVRGNRLIDGQPRPFSLSETLHSITAIVRPIGEEKGLAVFIENSTGDGRLGYPAALHRVLLNLLSNALRYTEAGTVTVGCDEPSATAVRFWVQDTGNGIPPHVMSMIYDGFRPGSVGLRFSAAGLGLAICQSLLDAMGSALKIETTAHGTRFWFVLELPRVQ